MRSAAFAAFIHGFNHEASECELAREAELCRAGCGGGICYGVVLKLVCERLYGVMCRERPSAVRLTMA